MIAIASRTPFAELRTNQLGSWESFSQLPNARFAGPRAPTHNCAQTSCERFSQLPPLHRVGLRSVTQKPVVNEKSFHNFHNLNFLRQFRVLSPISSCGGETTPTGKEEGACGYAWRLLLLPPVRCFRARVSRPPFTTPTPNVTEARNDKPKDCGSFHRFQSPAPRRHDFDVRGAEVRGDWKKAPYTE
jgi:hypothetical protein